MRDSSAQLNPLPNHTSTTRERIKTDECDRNSFKRPWPDPGRSCHEEATTSNQAPRPHDLPRPRGGQLFGRSKPPSFEKTFMSHVSHMACTKSLPSPYACKAQSVGEAGCVKGTENSTLCCSIVLPGMEIDLPGRICGPEALLRDMGYQLASVHKSSGPNKLSL